MFTPRIHPILFVDLPLCLHWSYSWPQNSFPATWPAHLDLQSISRRIDDFASTAANHSASLHLKKTPVHLVACCRYHDAVDWSRASRPTITKRRQSTQDTRTCFHRSFLASSTKTKGIELNKNKTKHRLLDWIHYARVCTAFRQPSISRMVLISWANFHPPTGTTRSGIGAPDSSASG